jgi:hypothetical protein
MAQVPVSMGAFIAARKEGKTVKELSDQFGISAANCKAIIKQLDLPKRATKPGFVLVNDMDNTTSVNQTNTTNFQTV